MKIFLIIPVCCLAVAGCGSDGSDGGTGGTGAFAGTGGQASGGAAGAATGGSAGSAAGGAGGISGAGGAAGNAGAGGATCATGSICVEVKMVLGQSAPTAVGRLGVVWVDPADLGNSAKWQVGYDTSFGPQVNQYAIPTNKIAPPAASLAYCGSGGCSGSTPKVFLGGIVAAKDANKNGALDIKGEVDVIEKIGIGYTIIVSSSQDHKTAPAPPQQAFQRCHQERHSCLRYQQRWHDLEPTQQR